MQTFTSKNGTDFQFADDLSAEVGITTKSGREIWVSGADLVEFIMHLPPEAVMPHVHISQPGTFSVVRAGIAGAGMPRQPGQVS